MINRLFVLIPGSNVDILTTFRHSMTYIDDGRPAKEPMMPEDTMIDQRPAPVTTAPAVTVDELVNENLLVEEVSIDGMCGVY